VKKLSATYRKTLDFLDRNGKVTVREISDRMRTNSDSIRNQLKFLEKNGLAAKDGEKATYSTNGAQSATVYVITEVGKSVLRGETVENAR
jgi:predicted transcriptional regulator